MEQSFIDQVFIELQNPNGSPLGNILNALSLIKEMVGDGSWVGIYLYDEGSEVLRLGPFQGKEACVLIKPHKGLVGECFCRNEEIYAPDVNLQSNYISCDPSTLSEYVCPLQKADGSPFGVFDIDSPKLDGLKELIPILKTISEVLKTAPYLTKFPLFID